MKPGKIWSRETDAPDLLSVFHAQPLFMSFPPTINYLENSDEPLSNPIRGGAQQALSPPRLFPPKSVAQACSSYFPAKIRIKFSRKNQEDIFPVKIRRIFFPPKSEAYLSCQNQKHILPAKIRSIFFPPKSEAYFPAKIRPRAPTAPNVQFASFPAQPSINPSIPCSCCYLFIVLCQPVRQHRYT
jgi:hypothetical protein